MYVCGIAFTSSEGLSMPGPSATYCHIIGTSWIHLSSFVGAYSTSLCNFFHKYVGPFPVLRYYQGKPGPSGAVYRWGYLECIGKGIAVHAHIILGQWLRHLSMCSLGVAKCVLRTYVRIYSHVTADICHRLVWRRQYSSHLPHCSVRWLREAGTSVSDRGSYTALHELFCVKIKCSSLMKQQPTWTWRKWYHPVCTLWMHLAPSLVKQ